MQDSNLLSPNGRLRPLPFVTWIVMIYLLGAVSHALTMPDVMTRGWLWPFAAAQAVLTWAWYVLHARRLRDAGRSAGLAAGIASIYTLSVALLLILAAAFFGSGNSPLGNPNAAAALSLILLVYIVGTLAASSDYGLGWAVIAILTFLACVPTLIAVIFSIWTASRPSAAKS